MRRFFPLLIFFSLLAQEGKAQHVKVFGHICHYSGEEDSSITTVHRNSTTLPRESETYKLISLICNKVFNGINLDEKVTVRANTIRVAPSAYPYIEDDNSTKLYISLNQSKLQSIVGSAEGQRAVLILALAHELKHIASSDILQPLDNRFNNYDNELQADEIAGMAVGLLTNEDMMFFDKVMPQLLKEDSASLSHPNIQFRIMAAKAGWLKSKLGASANNSSIVFGGSTYVKTYSETYKSIQLGKSAGTSEPNNFVYQFSDTTTQSKLYTLSPSGSGQPEWTIEYNTNSSGRYLALYHFYDKNSRERYSFNISWKQIGYANVILFPYFGKMNRTGKYYLLSGTIKDGEMGDNYLMQGWGRIIDANGNVQIGLFENDLQEGYGLRLSANGRIEKGIWHQGKLISPE